jgi:hypothetical protein
MVGLGNYKSEASRFEASVLQMAPSDTDSTSSWIAFGKKIPRSEIVFLCQEILYSSSFPSFFQNALDLVYVVLFNDFLYLFGIKCSFQNFTVVVFD